MRTTRAGSLYDLLTLRVAYGVSLYGEATEEYTWFPGYAWMLAYCRGCSAHLARACCCVLLVTAGIKPMDAAVLCQEGSDMPVHVTRGPRSHPRMQAARSTH